jgi:hypothetical protein
MVELFEYFETFNKPQERVIPTLVYTIFTDFATAMTFVGDYNLDFINPLLTEFYNLLAQLFVNIIYDNLISTEIITRIIVLINTYFLNHRSLIPLINDYKMVENKISILYCIVNNIRNITIQNV